MSVTVTLLGILCGLIGSGWAVLEGAPAAVVVLVYPGGGLAGSLGAALWAALRSAPVLQPDGTADP